MRAEVTWLELRLRRRMLVGTALGTALYLFAVVAVYPAFSHDTSFDAVLTENPSVAAALGISGSITTPSGWLGANLYANFGPLLAFLLTIGYGAAAIAGQDGEGLLGLLAALPSRRRAVLAQKALALLLASVVVPAVAYAVCLLGPRFDLVPDWSALAQVSAATMALAYDFGAIALLVGAISGSRGLALGVASAVAAAAYLVSSLAPVVSGLHALRWLSPFTWAVGADQLAHGVTLGEAGALVALGAILTTAAALAFRRLDVH